MPRSWLSGPAEWLSGPAEWLTAAGVLLNVVPVFLRMIPGYASAEHNVWHTIEEVLSRIGIAAFLAGVVVAISMMKKRSEAAEKELAQIRVVSLSIQDKADYALKYGPAVSSIRDLLDQIESKNDPLSLHIRIAGEVLRDHAREYVPDFAKHLSELSSSTAIIMREPYFISELLKRMASSLPNGSVWFGITHLIGGWLKDKGNSGFTDFADKMRYRSHQKELCIFRIYSTREELQSEDIRGVLRDETTAGIQVKTLTREEHAPRDMSLIWPPAGNVSFKRLIESTDPIRLLREIQPICAMEFDARGGRSLDRLSIYAPGSPDFEELKQEFAAAWRRAQPFTGESLMLPKAG